MPHRQMFKPNNKASSPKSLYPDIAAGKQHKFEEGEESFHVVKGNAVYWLQLTTSVVVENINKLIEEKYDTINNLLSNKHKHNNESDSLLFTQIGKESPRPKTELKASRSQDNWLGEKRADMIHSRPSTQQQKHYGTLGRQFNHMPEKLTMSTTFHASSPTEHKFTLSGNLF